MAEADAQRWDGKHATGRPVEAEPPALLRGREHLLAGGGRALDVACGRGAVAVWLAARGFVVDAVDISPVALEALAALAERHGVADRVRTHRHDLDAGLPAGTSSGYDLVVCQRFRDPARYPALAAAPVPGGLLAITVLSGGDGPFRAAPGELRAAFAALEVIEYREGDGEQALLARRTGAGP
ncbi:methyltransferase domain-containing protein [Pseudonocardia lacus]|uniref:methyltransferase domain-containing protein n=1 Tax=Pseudonocardia lacus TaxID=2835865 RepID=UPI001BDDAFF2|nr:methyltransferase domain-containing protein [Pseudonocardia lacus]